MGIRSRGFLSSCMQITTYKEDQIAGVLDKVNHGALDSMLIKTSPLLRVGPH